VDVLIVVPENMIRRHTFQLIAAAASVLLSGCIGTELARTPTYHTDHEIEHMIQGKWYQEDLHLRGARVLQPAILVFYADGRVDYSFTYLTGDSEVRTSHTLFWRVKERNLIYSDTPAGEPTMTGGVITKISTRGFDVYTTQATFGRYYRSPRRGPISI
jgi:hypothetical protein